MGRLSSGPEPRLQAWVQVPCCAAGGALHDSGRVSPGSPGDRGPAAPGRLQGGAGPASQELAHPSLPTVGRLWTSRGCPPPSTCQTPRSPSPASLLCPGWGGRKPWQCCPDAGPESSLSTAALLTKATGRPPPQAGSPASILTPLMGALCLHHGAASPPACTAGCQSCKLPASKTCAAQALCGPWWPRPPAHSGAFLEDSVQTLLQLRSDADLVTKRALGTWSSRWV